MPLKNRLCSSRARNRVSESLLSALLPHETLMARCLKCGGRPGVWGMSVAAVVVTAGVGRAGRPLCRSSDPE